MQLPCQTWIRQVLALCASSPGKSMLSRIRPSPCAVLEAQVCPCYLKETSLKIGCKGRARCRGETR